MRIPEQKVRSKEDPGCLQLTDLFHYRLLCLVSQLKSRPQYSEPPYLLFTTTELKTLNIKHHGQTRKAAIKLSNCFICGRKLLVISNTCSKKSKFKEVFFINLYNWAELLRLEFPTALGSETTDILIYHSFPTWSTLGTGSAPST